MVNKVKRENGFFEWKIIKVDKETTLMQQTV